MSTRKMRQMSQATHFFEQVPVCWSFILTKTTIIGLQIAPKRMNIIIVAYKITLGRIMPSLLLHDEGAVHHVRHGHRVTAAI